ncbi:MAG: sigma-70 family RNA polymerase sigma factor [Planctomycetes bacterium]|nr:sigma-70 family RNA polymerase sigma factor [Planctomycetota bacterium]MCC7171840.1 sigma-70 family RNA polymerase sigma factor [Planctomycetota bacterium]
MSPPVVDEPILLERARSGDHAAFDALLQRFAPCVRGVLMGYVPAADADDLMQDVFLAAWRALPELNDTSAFGAWLSTIARNRARRHLARRIVLEPLPDELVDTAPPSRADHTPSGEEILALLRTLPEAYREPLLLRLVERMGGAEIAAATGLTHGSVRVNLSRGMEMLRERLRQRGWP